MKQAQEAHTAVVLFCRYYHDDVLRARRLLESVTKFNTEGLPLYLAVPAADVPLFRQRCARVPGSDISWKN